jgi:hypothetical protein
MEKDDFPMVSLIGKCNINQCEIFDLDRHNQNFNLQFF